MVGEAGGTARSTASAPVLFLGGFGRSGSTLLERMLGRVPGVTALGEVLHLPERGLVDGDRCGCGRPFRECPFWREVGELGFGGWASVDPAPVVAARRALVTNRRTASLVRRSVPEEPQARAYAEFLRRLYGAAREVAGGTDVRLLVDSSKHPAYAFELRRHVHLRAVLVVRDSRGVAHSWARHVERPEVTGGGAFMPTYGPAGSALRWTTYSLLFDLLARTGTPSLVVRYEDLVASPAPTLDRVLTFAGLPVAPDVVAADGRTVELAVDHTVAGNPMRFRTGPIELRSDEEWRAAMPRRDRLVVEGLSLPLLARYGYLRRR